VGAEGFAPVELDAVLEQPNTTMRVLVHLRALTKQQAPGGTWIPALPAKVAGAFDKASESLRSGNLRNAQDPIAKLMKAAPGHPEVNYLAGVLSYKRNEPAQAAVYFAKAAYLNPESADAARALGGVYYRSGHYPEAERAFTALAELRPDAWEPEWAIASAAFQARRFPEAREHARQAVERGGSTAAEPRLLEALADAWLEKFEEARKTAQAILADSTDPQLTATARDLLTSLTEHISFVLDLGHPQPLPLERSAAVLIRREFLEPHLPARLWAPPDVDDEEPTVARNTPCSVEAVLATASKEVVRLAKDLGEVGANEKISQEEVDGLGHARVIHNLAADYYAEIKLLKNGELSVDEYRNGNLPEPTADSAPFAHGLAALAPLIFHPIYMKDFKFRCEGLTQWQGHPAWSIYFAQFTDRPSRVHTYVNNGRSYSAYVRGRALFDQASGEILHIETDLIDPILDLRLEQEHLVVDYREVEFRTLRQRFRLPSQAELYVHLHGRLYHVKHSLDKYILFTVDTHQKIQELKPPKQ
jgi:tetratricopeptide (TPR) repeat protein